MCYQTDKAGDEEWETGKRAIKEGLKVEHLSRKQVQKIEPNAGLDIKGAVYYHSDAHMTPNNFMEQLKVYLKKNGVSILGNEEVLDVKISGNKVTSITTTNLDVKSDEFVIATGAWSQNFAKKLGIKIPIQAGKGYSINVKKETNIKIPAILIEAKVAVTPMDSFTRFAGTMEIGGINHKINPVRVNAIAGAGERYFNGLKITEKEKAEAQCGLRPLTPDGLPYIGKTDKCKNLTIATGHAMMGWSLGPATGKLVSEIISNQRPSLDLQPYNPSRKF